MKYYYNKYEKCAPEAPLKDIHLSVILGDEYKLFHELHKFNGKDKTSMINKLTEINDYIASALYFKFQYLHIKLSAVTASIIESNHKLIKLCI